MTTKQNKKFFYVGRVLEFLTFNFQRLKQKKSTSDLWVSVSAKL